MTGIGPTDQIVLLLREQLQRGERAKGRPFARNDDRPATPQQRIEALAAVEELPEREFRRAVVRGLLREHFGAELVADPAFETVTGEVFRMIEESDGGKALLDRVARDFGRG